MKIYCVENKFANVKYSKKKKKKKIKNYTGRQTDRQTDNNSGSLNEKCSKFSCDK